MTPHGTASDGDLISGEYRAVDFETLQQQFLEKPEELVDAAFLSWSQEVESAVDKALNKARLRDPTRHAVSSLHASYKGRCSFRKNFVEKKTSGVKSDRHGGYTPPVKSLH